jgi:hypothetical protein
MLDRAVAVVAVPAPAMIMSTGWSTGIAVIGRHVGRAGSDRQRDGGHGGRRNCDGAEL